MIKSALILLLFALPLLGQGKTVMLSWDDNPEPDILNYVLSWGLVPGNYPNSINVSPTNQVLMTNGLFARASISNLLEDVFYYVTVRAVNKRGLIGDPSNEVVVQPTTRQSVVLITQFQVSPNGLGWIPIGGLVSMEASNLPPRLFFRADSYAKVGSNIFPIPSTYVTPRPH